MKKNRFKNYKKPKIYEKKLKINFFSFNYRDPLTGDFLAIYCGQCTPPCNQCGLPFGCDKISS